jgi:hypothetical protein
MSCESCAMCCRLLSITELNKPAGKWCGHAKPGALPGACQIYEDRPLSCKAFKCLWLASQATKEITDRLPISLRPDNSKVMMIMGGADGDDLVLHVDPGYPGIWRKDQQLMSIINRMLSAQKEVLIVCGEKRTLLSPDQETATKIVERAKEKYAQTQQVVSNNPEPYPHKETIPVKKTTISATLLAAALLAACQSGTGSSPVYHAPSTPHPAPFGVHSK